MMYSLKKYFVGFAHSLNMSLPIDTQDFTTVLIDLRFLYHCSLRNDVKLLPLTILCVDLRKVTGDRELESREAAIEEKAKLSMMCWNVCGRCREGSGMEQMREKHDIRKSREDRFLQTRCGGIDRDVVERGGRDYGGRI